ncbi:up-regulator of cell proliferation-like [Anableps anableps]
MREVVRNFTPLQQAFRRSSSEERLVHSEIPLVSFARLGKHFISKSQMLNKLLSNTEQYHDIFYHSALECGDVPRRISEGLLEFSWYLPCVISSVDKFNEPMAVANLRGDIRSFGKQFTFLCQSSAVVYIFCDESDFEYFKHLQGKHVQAKCGQRYTFADGLPEFSNLRRKMEQLPTIFPQILLDSSPFELVDGDAGNIPSKWINAVLTELHSLLQFNSRVKVISVIGSENSGKSTLLNAMFGTRFAVNKGMCTRGAFMQLITVSKYVKRELGCDCIMIIDTEGLKAHEMVQDDHSHERDKEVATLAVALSDIKVVSISKDTSVEKEFLRMVLNALTRVKAEDKKPLCHFVQVDMTGMCTSEEKKRDKALLEQLNVMIQRDVQIKATKLTDVVDFDRRTWSWHLPSVWKGTPPMASYSSDYSEIVQALKSRLLKDLKKCPERGDLIDFAKRVESYWKSL